MSAPTPQTSARVRAFDWLRGLAVLVMIQCHALTLLRADLRQTAAFGWLVRLDGLVAPAFIFSAGFSLALVQVRGSASGARRQRVLKTLIRILEVLAIAFLGDFVWFPVFREPQHLLRMEILHCIGLSLLIALPLMAALSKRPKLLRWVTLGLALVVFGLAPVAESWSGPLAFLVKNSPSSPFPLFPWAGYVYLGASAGATAALGTRRASVAWIVGLWALGAAAWLASPLWLRLYPPHAFFVTDPGNHGQRLFYVVFLLLLLFAFETFSGARARSALPIRFIEVFGASSLAGYFLHEFLLYGPWLGLSFNAHWQAACSWLGYAGLTALLIALTFALTWLVDRAYRPYDAAVRRAVGLSR